MSYIGNTVQNQSFVPTVDYFSGDGSTVAFTLSHPVGSVYELEVVVNNVQQNPSSAYTVNGSTITFTSAPSSGSNNIYVYYVSPNTQIVQPGQGTVGTAQIADAAVTTAKIADANVTQAKLAAGVAGNGPAFSAYASAGTSMTNNTNTKIAFATEEYDTNSNYDTSTARFTPTIAGYYYINVLLTAPVSGSAYYSAFIYKNGSMYINGLTNAAIGIYKTQVSGLVYCNGSTDYIEVYGLQSSGGTITSDASALVKFQGFLARSA